MEGILNSYLKNNSHEGVFVLIPIILAFVSILVFISVSLLTIQTANSIYILSLISLISIYLFSERKKTYLFLLFFSLIIDIRGEVLGIPVQAWEAVSLPIIIYTFINIRKFNNYSIPLLLLLLVAFISGLLNENAVAAMKGSFRWFEYFSIFNIFTTRYFLKDFTRINYYQFLIVPFIVLLLLNNLQFFYYGPDWLDIMDSDFGRIVYGPQEVLNRLEGNNYLYNSNTIRGMGVYLSPPDLAFVCGISLFALFYTKLKIYIKLPLVLMITEVMLLTMGRAGLLYMVFVLIIVNVVMRKQYEYFLYGSVFLMSALLIEPIRNRLLLLLVSGAEHERILIWNTAFNIWKSSPLYGVGGGQITVLFNQFAAVDWLIDRQGVSHSAYFGILAEYGIIGFLLYVVFFTKILIHGIRNSVKNSSVYLQISLILYALMLSVSTDIYQGGNPVFVLLLIFLGYTLRNEIACLNCYVKYPNSTESTV